MKLPHIYRGEKNPNTTHNRKYCYLEKNKIPKDINCIEKYWIKTTKKEYETYIVYYNKEYIKTVEGMKINQNDIIEIKRIS